LLLQVAPFLRKNPDVPLLLGQARLPRLLAPPSLNVTIVAPPAASELFFVRRLIQPTQQHCGRLSPSLWTHLRASFLHPSSNHLPLLQPDWSLRLAEGGGEEEGKGGEGKEGEGEEGEGRVVVVAMPRGVHMAEFDWLVGRLRQQFGERKVTVVKRLGWKQARTLLPLTSLLVSLPLPSLLPLLIYSRPNSSLLLLHPPLGLPLSQSPLSSSSSPALPGEYSEPSKPRPPSPSHGPFLSSSSIIQSLSATCHLHVVSVPSERLDSGPLVKLWLVTEPEAREDGELDMRDPQGEILAAEGEGGGTGKSTVKGTAKRGEGDGDGDGDGDDWGEEWEEERRGEGKAEQAGSTQEDADERGEAEEGEQQEEEDEQGMRITWSREDLGEAVSEVCLHLGMDHAGPASTGSTESMAGGVGSSRGAGSAAAAREKISDAERRKRDRLAKRMQRREAEAWKVPGSWLRRRRDVRVFERWLECISREGNWVYNPTPRVLPWEYPGFMNLCDHRQKETGLGVSGIKADEIVRRGGSEEEWTVRESLKYEWRTPPGRCPLGGLKPFDGAAFCKRAREERGTFKIVFLGDSLTFQMAGSFLNGLLRHVTKPASWAVDESEPKQCVDWLLGREGEGARAGDDDGSGKLRRTARWRKSRSEAGNATTGSGGASMGDEEVGEGGEEEEEEEEETAPVVVTPHAFCKLYVFHENVCPGVMVHVIRNDHLYIQDPDLSTSADSNSTGSTSSTANGSATSGSVPFDHMPWHLYDGLLSADVVVVNRGAHFVGGRDFELSVRAAMRLLRRKLPRALIVYRNSPPGHANCSSYDRPIKIRQDPATLPFHWDTFSAQNDIAREIAEEVKAVYMDVDTMTALRPDGHKGYVKERGITDCLHYCTPGPVDTWVEILGNIIAHGVFNEGFEK
ncbi:hypothetical protein CLOM_g22887, partial [Closterium sp. NIES-68]